MRIKKTLQIWASQVRANFLILPVALVCIGGAESFRMGHFRFGPFYLTLIGTALAHISVNLFNEYSDYRSKIDFYTTRTPFSGGSGMLQKGHTSPQTVKLFAWLSLGCAILIGLYLAMLSGWFLILVMLIGGLAVTCYTDYLSKWILGELFAGLCLGSLVVLGSYYVQTRNINLAVVLLSVPPGILTGLLLLLNEFPDVEADKKGGRKHLVIKYGKRSALKIYETFTILCYLLIFLGSFTHLIPRRSLIALLSLPFAILTIKHARLHLTRNYSIVPALKWNVLMVLSTDFLLFIGILASA